MSKQLLKSTSIVGGMTLVSRVSGLIRDIIFAQFLGAGILADAFLVAFRIPNFLRRIFAEGAFSVAFIPVFTDIRQIGTHKEQQQFVGLMAGRLGLILMILTALGVLFAPQVVQVLAYGWSDDPRKIAITVDTVRLTFPYLLCISLVSMSAGILNTCSRFAAAAVTPIFLNLFLISAVLWFVPWFENAAIALGFGVFLAGFFQLLFQLPFLLQVGYLPKPALRSKSTAARKSVTKVFQLMLPALFGSSIAQINILVNTILASFLVTGSVSWLYYSDRLMEFPLGVFGIALATAILPGLSRQYTDNDTIGFNQTLNTAIKWVCVVCIPAAVALAVLAKPLLITMFFYRQFNQTDVYMSANALVAYSFGLLGFVFVKVLAPGYFARQNTLTPVKIGATSVGVNIILSLALVSTFEHVGLAIATSIAAFVNAGLLGFYLRKDKVLHILSGLGRVIVSVCVASLIMAVVLWYSVGQIEIWFEYNALRRIGSLSITILAGFLSYVLTLILLGLRLHHVLSNNETVDKKH